MCDVTYPNSRISRDYQITRFNVAEKLNIPQVSDPNNNKNNFAFPTIPGGLVYNPDDDGIYYSDGFKWNKLVSSGFIPGGGIFGGSSGYSFIKQNITNIPDSTYTTLNVWDTSDSSAYVSDPDWDLITGIFTASENENISIHVEVSWSANISTIGVRVLQILYKPVAGLWSVIKEQITQPNPDIAIPTPQKCSINAELRPGDMIKIACYQNSGGNVAIENGYRTSVCGNVIRA